MSDNKRMRIAFLTHQWPGARMGGIGAAICNTAEAMAVAGHDVHVFTFELPDDVRPHLPGSIRLHEIPTLARRVQEGDVPAPLAAATQAGGDGVYRLALATLLCEELLRHHRDHPFDIVEAPEVEALGLPLSLRPDIDLPVVAHLHCATAIAQRENASPVATGDNALPALEFAAIHLADAVCAPTRAVVEATRACCPISADVAIIPHPVSARPGDFAPPPKAGPILFVGRLERLKGVEALADALNLFLPRHPGAAFRFVGPDTNTAPGRSSMRAWIESKLSPSVSARVQFTGEISAARVAEEWSGARFGVMPSLSENFSMACCEAMSAGRTLVVGEGTGSVELIGAAGIVARRASPDSLCAAMESLWTDHRKLVALSRAAFERTRTTFAPVEIARQRTAFYQQVLRNFATRAESAPNRNLLSLPPQCAAALLPALARLTATLAGVPSDVPTPGARLLRIMNGLQSSRGAPAEVILYGAGKHTARLMSERHLWESRRHRVVGIIDDHPRFAQSPLYLDVPVQSMGTAKARVLAGQPLPPVVLSTDTYEDQFWRQSAPLREAGVPVFRLYS